ncbi:alpha/beta fold hydrolase [Actinopolymorpha alba]|uniref:alpha/beta fold hydrolase n=1 Tax=Actinopolymorpha alba TaxID=533267 RepID=UPI0003807D77|nr:alpha/beta hydrolase [Actinopolymorpha alba]
MNEKMVRANGVDLCVETFGDPSDPGILLIGGAASSMDWWEEEFCERLAAGPRFVIRYDLRDTGRSVSYPPGAPGYTQPDLVADALGLLDVLGLARAHLVGISMGGGMAQRIGVEHPERAASLTLISTSPGGPGGPSNPDLPPISEKLLAVFSEPSPDPDWSDREQVIEYVVDGQRPFAATSAAFDEERMRRIATQVVDRSSNIESSMKNHWILKGGEPVRSRLGSVTAPTLVLHGTEDPLFPYGHAVALANEIPGARLIPLEQTGHEMPPPAVWDVVVPAILAHTEAR